MKFVMVWLVTSIVAASAQADTVSNFNRSLVGFQCNLDDEQQVIVFGEVAEELILLSPSSDAPLDRRDPVKRTSTGYQFIDSEGITSFLSNLDDDGWTLFSSSETGVLSAKCVEAGDVPVNIAKTVFDFVGVLSAEEVKLAQRETELLYQQVAALRKQLGDLESLLDDAVARDAAREVELLSLASRLNTALARVAAEERRRANADAARAELEADRHYRSEFFGRLRDVLGAQEGVQVEGDRFVFSSDVLFSPGGAMLSLDGRREVAKVTTILRNVADDIPDGINWIIRLDGHTDDAPLSGAGEFADNWELSQARALSVVKYMSQSLGIPPDRLSANGFGQYQPVATGDSEEARARNRRIELRLTEK